MTRRFSLPAVVLTALTLLAAAPANAKPRRPRAGPSDRAIRARLMKKGALEVVLSKNRNRFTLLLRRGLWEYARYIEVTRKSRWPGIKVVVRGDVVYRRRFGSRTWRYDRFRIGDNIYLGLKSPKPAEVVKIIEAVGLRKVLPGTANVIPPPKKFLSLKMAPKPKWTWHSPNSVSFMMIAVYWMKNTYTTKKKVEQPLKIRLYRKARKDNWLSLCAGGARGCIMGSPRGSYKVLEQAPCSNCR